MIFNNKDENNTKTRCEHNAESSRSEPLSPFLVSFIVMRNQHQNDTLRPCPNELTLPPPSETSLDKVCHIRGTHLLLAGSRQDELVACASLPVCAPLPFCAAAVAGHDARNSRGLARLPV